MCADTDEPDIRDRSDRPARCAQQARRAVRSTDAVPSALVPPLPDAEPDRMARLDRLSASDLLTLQSGEAGWPMDIGVVAVFEGGALVDANGRFRADAAREAVRRRLSRVPRFRQVLRVPPRVLGPPVWVDGPNLDLARHVQVRPLAPAADTAGLLGVVEELWSTPLDLASPLWRLWFLPGLAGGRVAMLLKVHHVMADGVAGMGLLATLLDRDEDPTVDDRPAAPPPSAAALVRDELGRLGDVARTSLASGRPAALRDALQRSRATLREFDAVRHAARTSLDRVVGPGRRLGVVGRRLDTVRGIAHAHGATVNDVLLSAVAGGLGALLRSRGEEVHDVAPLAYEPVTLLLRRRAGGRPDDAGMIFVPLPVGVADPVERLRRVAAATADRKRHVIPAPVGLPTRTLLVRRIMMRVAARQRWAAVYVADVPGPRTRLSLEGAELQELFPVVPLAGRTPIGVGALSYAGRLGITVVADRDACPDIGIFTDGLSAALAELERTAASVPDDLARR